MLQTYIAYGLFGLCLGLGFGAGAYYCQHKCRQRVIENRSVEIATRAVNMVVSGCLEHLLITPGWYQLNGYCLNIARINSIFTIDYSVRITCSDDAYIGVYGQWWDGNFRKESLKNNSHLSESDYWSLRRTLQELDTPYIQPPEKEIKGAVVLDTSLVITQEL